MDRIVVAIVGSKDQACAAAGSIRDFCKSGEFFIYALALIIQDREKATVLDLMNEDRNDILLKATRRLARLLAEPHFDLLDSAIVAEASTAMAKVGIDTTFLAEIKRHLLPGRTAIAAEIEEENTAAMDILLKSQSSVVFRCDRRAVMDLLLFNELDVLASQIQMLENRLLQSSAGPKADLKNELDLAKSRFHEKKNQARYHAAGIKREAEAKIVALQEWAAKADGAIKAKLEHFVDEVRANYVSRATKLNFAWQLAGSVTAPYLIFAVLTDSLA